MFEYCSLLCQAAFETVDAHIEVLKSNYTGSYGAFWN